MTFTVFGVLLLFNSTLSSPHRLHCPDQTFFFPLSLFSILTVPFRPLKIYSSFSSSKKKKTYRLILCFLLGALKFLESGSTQKNLIKKSSRKFLVIFPKRSTEISSLPNFWVLSKFSPQSSLSSFAKFQIGFDAFSKLRRSGWGSSYF